MYCFNSIRNSFKRYLSAFLLADPIPNCFKNYFFEDRGGSIFGKERNSRSRRLSFSEASFHFIKSIIVEKLRLIFIDKKPNRFLSKALSYIMTYFEPD